MTADVVWWKFGVSYYDYSRQCEFVAVRIRYPVIIYHRYQNPPNPRSFQPQGTLSFPHLALPLGAQPLHLAPALRAQRLKLDALLLSHVGHPVLAPHGPPQDARDRVLVLRRHLAVPPPPLDLGHLDARAAGAVRCRAPLDGLGAGGVELGLLAQRQPTGGRGAVVRCDVVPGRPEPAGEVEHDAVPEEHEGVEGEDGGEHDARVDEVDLGRGRVGRGRLKVAGDVGLGGGKVRREAEDVGQALGALVALWGTGALEVVERERVPVAFDAALPDDAAGRESGGGGAAEEGDELAREEVVAEDVGAPDLADRGVVLGQWADRVAGVGALEGRPGGGLDEALGEEVVGDLGPDEPGESANAGVEDDGV